MSDTEDVLSVLESCGGPINFLSVLLGFAIGILFTLSAICCGVTTAWGVNYNITRKLRDEYAPPYDSLVRQHHFPEEMDQISPGVINSEVGSKTFCSSFFLSNSYFIQFILSNSEDVSTDSFQLKWESIVDT